MLASIFEADSATPLPPPVEPEVIEGFKAMGALSEDIQLAELDGTDTVDKFGGFMQAMVDALDAASGNGTLNAKLNNLGAAFKRMKLAYPYTVIKYAGTAPTS